MRVIATSQMVSVSPQKTVLVMLVLKEMTAKVVIYFIYII